MINDQLAEIFTKMAAYCEMSKEKNAFFRSRAFKKAAEVLDKLPFDLSEPQWHDEKKLVELEGIGKGIAKHIVEYIELGKIPDYENMKAESPVDLEELLKVQGIGPKTILKLYKELGVTNLETLKKAAEEDKISNLEGFGPKKQQNIIESIQFAIRNKDRIPYFVAEQHIKILLEYLQKDENLIKAEAVGSYRRKAETIGDIDILACSKKPEATAKHFTSYPEVEKVFGSGETKSSIWLKAKIQADLRIIDDDCFGSALQYFTGSKDHNVKLRKIAIDKGYKLSEYGLFERKTEKLIESKNEEKIYKIIINNYIEPELRENSGEIELAIENKLPNLITEKDIEGDFHLHSTNSDGINTIEEMANAAIERGYKAIGISDHFGALRIANAIDESEFRKYITDIRTTDEKISGIKIFASGEVEINKDGELDFNHDLLKELDYVIGSVHLSTKMSRSEMTARIIKALKDPLIKILAHPTGRLIGQRPGFEFDYEEVFKVAKEEGVALEINCHPMRLDLPWDLVQLAQKIGCKIILNTDSHSINELKNLKYGINIARKGWLEKENLWNPLKDY
jgi:DNA polymerase (family 10)